MVLQLARRPLPPTLIPQRSSPLLAPLPLLAQVRLFHPVNCLEADGGDDPPLGTATSVATVRLAGLVRGRAFAGGKDRVCDGLRSLRRDLARTVDRRLVLLLDEVAEEEGCDSRSPLPAGEARSWPLPRRAHFEVEGGLSLCDYLTEGEDTSEFGDKVAEVLGGQVPWMVPWGVAEWHGGWGWNGGGMSTSARAPRPAQSWPWRSGPWGCWARFSPSNVNPTSPLPPHHPPSTHTHLCPASSHE
eukprot:scaffold2957_cov226-Isochrysis_galbana.AAC.6